MNSKEEAIAKGIPLAPPKNDKQRRAPWHDYSLPGLYMLTIVTRDRQCLLGRLVCLPYPKVEYSTLGYTILHDELKKIHQTYPNVKLWKACIMPDHIHLIVEVSGPFPENKHLGSVVSGFKTGCNRAYRRLFGLEEGTMFSPHYNDRIILPGMQNEHWKRYLDENPRRLAIKHMHPEYFTSRYAVGICGEQCQIFGNLFLLEIPDKMDVIVHRADTDDEYAHKCQAWMACGERGGVLVSAAIADREKRVIKEALNRGYCVIQLCENGFGPLHKPQGALFDACAAGHLLQIALWEYHADRRRISRQQCLCLNALASKIATHQGPLRT